MANIKLEKHLEDCLRNAFIRAALHRFRFVTAEMLLLELLKTPDVKRMTEALGADVDALKRSAAQAAEDHTPKVPEDAKAGATVPSVSFKRVVERAIVHVKQARRENRMVFASDVIVSLFEEEDSWAAYCMEEAGLVRLDVMAYLTENPPAAPEDEDDFGNGSDDGIAEEIRIHLASRGEDGEDCREEDETGEEDPDACPGERSAAVKDPFKAWTVDLNLRAEEGKLDPLIGRDAEVRRVIQILCRRRKNNPILVGDPGVGKTAIAEGIAEKIVKGEVPSVLKNRRIVSLSMGALVAGTKYRGDFEKRIKSLLDAVRSHPEVILFIDEIHTVVGAGSSAEAKTLDAADLFKPALSNGELSCIGATTYDEFRQVFEKDHALARRFQKVDVPAPSEAESELILKGLLPRFEAHHEVKFGGDAVSAAVSLANRFLNDKKLPDSAIDVIDEAGAAQRLLPPEARRKVLHKKDIEETVAAIARVPVSSVSAGNSGNLAKLAERLSGAIFGQKEAVDTVVSAIKLSRAGLGNPEHPLGSFLFTGPTGVGKTELARQLARELGVPLLRYDMSEYSESHTVSRLIGAPPGYVGFSEGGQLTEAVTKHPYAVLLLDEIEKAHPEIFNILLQVMDRGTLTDNNGRHADFRNVVLIMTSNAGARAVSRNVIGFGESSGAGDDTQEINRIFSPEFRNRLDAIVKFRPLAEPLILRIVGKFLGELAEKLKAQGAEAEFSDDLRVYLAKNGFDPLMGARPMRRLIREKVEVPLADALLFGRAPRGAKRIAVGFSGGAVTVRTLPAKAVKKASAKAVKKTSPKPRRKSAAKDGAPV